MGLLYLVQVPHGIRILFQAIRAVKPLVTEHTLRVHIEVVGLVGHPSCGALPNCQQTLLVAIVEPRLILLGCLLGEGVQVGKIEAFAEILFSLGRRLLLLLVIDQHTEAYRLSHVDVVVMPAVVQVNDLRRIGPREKLLAHG